MEPPDHGTYREDPIRWRVAPSTASPCAPAASNPRPPAPANPSTGFSISPSKIPSIAPKVQRTRDQGSQDSLNNLRGPVKNENVAPLIKKKPNFQKSISEH